MQNNDTNLPYATGQPISTTPTVDLVDEPAYPSEENADHEVVVRASSFNFVLA